MAIKLYIAVCVSAVLVQVISAQTQCINSYNPGLINSFNNLNPGLAYNPGFAPSAFGNGGGLTVTSISQLAPSGVSVISNNDIEGVLEVGGSVPLLSTVAFEGTMPSSGAVGTTYYCGSGNVGIIDSLTENGLAAFGNGLGYNGVGLSNIGQLGLYNVNNGVRGCGVY